jgi:rRNA-processing protein FCF1
MIGGSKREESAAVTSKTAFLDTMIYLHYKAVEEVPWPELVGAEHVLILIPRITQRELDKHKDSHPQRKIRERARRILQQLEEWSASDRTPLRERVDIGVYQPLPRIDYAEFDLDPSRNDEVLLATILDYRQRNPGSEVMLITQDTTPRFTARHLGIPSIALSEDLALPVEPDPVEQENRELRKQLEKLQRAMPKLLLRFAREDPGNRLHVHLQRPPEDADEYIAGEIERIRNEYPALTLRAVANREPAFSVLAPLIPSGEFDRYNRELEEFYERYEQFLGATWNTFYSDHLTCRFQLEICNEGSAPGDDVDVWLRFPSGFKLVRAAILDVRKREPPKPPRGPRTATEMIVEQIHQSSIMIPPPLPLSLPGGVQQAPPPNVTGPDIRSNEGYYDVHWKVRRVKHNQCEDLDALATIFDHCNDARSFRIDYRVHAANLPEETKRPLHVVVQGPDTC